MTIQRLAVFVFAVFLNGCGDSNEVSPTGPKTIAPVQERYDTLSVLLRDGLSGTPTSGKHVLKSGSKMAYSYAVLDGYENGYAMLDSTKVPLIGEFVMGGNRSILAGSFKEVSLPPLDNEYLRDAEEVLTASNKEIAYSNHLENIFSLYRTLPYPEAKDRSRAISMRAFNNADLAEVRIANEALSGMTFDVSSTVGRSDFASLVHSTAPRGYVQGIVVNGMRTSAEDIPDIAYAGFKIFQEAGLPFAVPVNLFYNASPMRMMSEREICIMTLLFSCGLGTAQEMVEVVTQFLNSSSNLDAFSQKESRKLADEFDRRRREGKIVVALTHSQGVMIAREAIALLDRVDPCIAVVAIGSPIGDGGWRLARDNLRGFAVKGEVVGGYYPQPEEKQFPNNSYIAFSKCRQDRVRELKFSPFKDRAESSSA